MSGMNPWSAPPLVDQGNAAITGGTGVPIILGSSFVAATTPADATEDTLATFTLAANTLGANGGLRIWTLWSANANANVKTCRVKFGGTNFMSVDLANNQSLEVVAHIFNRNATNSQVGGAGDAATGLGLSATAVTTAAVDTTAAVSVLFTGQKATAGDTLILRAYYVEQIRFT